MRRSRVATVGAAIALGTVAACIVPLDDEFTGARGPVPVAAGDDAAVAPGCLAFGAQPGVMGLSGDLRSVAQADGGSLWIADQADLADGGVTLAAAFAVGGGASTRCEGWSGRAEGTAFDPSPLAPTGLVVALDLVATAGGLATYYALFTSDPAMALGLRLLGYGVARQDTTTGRFTPTGELLWNADRPSYGTSALVTGGHLYVHGCKSNEPLTDDCYVARVDLPSIESAAAYAYWSGSGWSPNPDDAASIARAAGGISVRADPSGKARLFMTYVPPFGTSLVARSAVTPEGPWSAPVELARCALDPTIPGVFCGGGEQHPELAPGSGALVLSYDARTLSTDAGINLRGFWPKIVALGVPAGLH